jgi:hypothetical protein
VRYRVLYMALVFLLHSLPFRREIHNTELLLVNFPFFSTTYWHIPLRVEMMRTCYAYTTAKERLTKS